MAIVKPNPGEQIKVISQVDSAVTCNEDDYEKYLESLDERHLDLSGEPTRFVLKKFLTWGEQDEVDKLKAHTEGRKVQPKMSFMAEDVRLSLVEIENPDSVPDLQKLKLEKDKWGKPTRDFVGILRDMKIVNDLFNARSSSHKANDDLKKS
tara:strand:+ start:463 stop:915 length:453 start_codon:yes stop_codon:yes gene_type:complete